MYRGPASHYPLKSAQDSFRKPTPAFRIRRRWDHCINLVKRRPRAPSFQNSFRSVGEIALAVGQNATCPTGANESRLGPSAMSLLLRCDLVLRHLAPDGSAHHTNKCTFVAISQETSSAARKARLFPYCLLGNFSPLQPFWTERSSRMKPP